MAEFEVTISGLKSAVGREKSIINKLSAACRDIDACRNALSTSVCSGYAVVKRNLGGLEEQVRASSNKVSGMATALSDIYGAYNAAETAVYGNRIGHAKVADAKNLSSTLLDAISSIVENIGFAGETASLIIKALSGDLQVKETAFGILNMIKEATGAVINHNDKNGPGWAKALLGDEADVAKMSEKTKAASKAVKWAGYALAAAENTYDNYEEFKDDGGISNPRFWGETILETGFDLAVAAGLSLLVPASAPLWAGIAITAAGGFVVWGIDKAVEHFTGKNLKETVSDFVMDGAEYVSNAMSSVGNAVSSAWNKITTPWKPVFSGTW